MTSPPPENSESPEKKNDVNEKMDLEVKPTILCLTCQEKNLRTSEFCTQCGTALFSSKKVEPVKLTKICPKCNNKYPETINFCLFDGTKLQNSKGGEFIQHKTSETGQQTNPLFTGFEVSARSQQSPIPLELIKTTTNLLIPSSKGPTSVKSVKTSYWSIPAPQRKKKWFLKWFSHVGFSRTNIKSYFVSLIYVSIIYSLWAPRQFEELITNNQWVLLIGLGFVSVIIITIILILPVISLGYTSTSIVQADRNDFQFRIESSLLLLTLVLNVFISSFPGPFPIILLPGEIKIRGLPPKNEISKALAKGIGTGIFISYIFIILFLLSSDIVLETPILFLNPNLVNNLKLLTIFGSGVCLLVMLPFGNALGRLIQNYNTKLYFFLLSLTLILFIAMFIIASPRTT